MPARVALALLLATACAEDTGVTGEASSSADPRVRSASVTVENVTLAQPAGTYRRWTIRLLEDAPGTPCLRRGPARVAIDVYTLFASAPRGTIPLATPPPIVFPAAFAALAEGGYLMGTLDIPLAATTGLVGTLTGEGVIDGVRQPVEIAFDAPTCAP